MQLSAVAAGSFVSQTPALPAACSRVWFSQQQVRERKADAPQKAADQGQTFVDGMPPTTTATRSGCVNRCFKALSEEYSMQRCPVFRSNGLKTRNISAAAGTNPEAPSKTKPLFLD